MYVCITWYMEQKLHPNISRAPLLLKKTSPDRLGLNNFFVNYETCGIRICRKKCVNYDKI